MENANHLIIREMVKRALPILFFIRGLNKRKFFEVHWFKKWFKFAFIELIELEDLALNQCFCLLKRFIQLYHHLLTSSQGDYKCIIK